MNDKLYLIEYDDSIDIDIIDYLPLNVCNHLKRKNLKSKKESLYGYLLLVYAISKYYNKLIIPEIDYSSNKPKLADYDLYFNISHSNGIVVLAISDNKDIGIDIELIREYDHRLALRIANETEISNIKTNKDLISLWTKKEAFVKLLGSSIFNDIKNLDLDSKNFEQIIYKNYIISICY